MRTFGRYVGVQILAYGIDMGGFLAIMALDGGPLIANGFAKLAAGGFAFLAHRRLTFGVHQSSRAAGQLLRYSLLLALNVPLATGLLALLLPWFSVAAAAKFLADVLCVGLTFLASRWLVFPPAPRGGDAA